MYAGKTMPVTADQVLAVRQALLETQNEFAARFSRTRFAVIRWEAHGIKLKYQSTRWYRWQSAVERAIQLSIDRGLIDEQLENLRKLQVFPPER